MKTPKRIISLAFACLVFASYTVTSFAADHNKDTGRFGTYKQLSSGKSGKYQWASGRFGYKLGSEYTEAYGWVINSSKDDVGKIVCSHARFKNRLTGKYLTDGATTYKLAKNKTNVKVYDYSGHPAETFALAKYICCFSYQTK